MIIQTIPFRDFIGDPAVKAKNQHKLDWTDLVEFLSVHQFTSSRVIKRMLHCSHARNLSSTSTKVLSEFLPTYYVIMH